MPAVQAILLIGILPLMLFVALTPFVATALSYIIAASVGIAMSFLTVYIEYLKTSEAFEKLARNLLRAIPAEKLLDEYNTHWKLLWIGLMCVYPWATSGAVVAVIAYGT